MCLNHSRRGVFVRFHFSGLLVIWGCSGTLWDLILEAFGVPWAAFCWFRRVLGTGWNLRDSWALPRTTQILRPWWEGGRMLVRGAHSTIHYCPSRLQDTTCSIQNTGYRNQRKQKPETGCTAQKILDAQPGLSAWWPLQAGAGGYIFPKQLLAVGVLAGSLWY